MDEVRVVTNTGSVDRAAEFATRKGPLVRVVAAIFGVHRAALNFGMVDMSRILCIDMDRT